ncbi:2-oxo acid dehydrogenase subunit E2 [Pseudomonadota bacterium]|nr:2-oxo acid dehydrogenase subunit E2 [Pseudomonadota bacterium]
MDTKKIFCPDIGDFEEVDVIEILVKEGQTVDIETPLVTLESDKATMDVPSDKEGTILTIDISIGDKVSKGTQLFSLKNSEAQVIQVAEKSQTDAAINMEKTPSEVIPIKVPDIGDFEEVDVIEILFKEGQTVDIETPLVTLESDKATMDVPSPLAGRIDRILVKIGNKVSKNDTLALIFSDANQDKQEQMSPEITDSLAEVKQSLDSAGDANAASQDIETIPPITSLKNIVRTSFASPSIRKFARELGVNITNVNGSGPKNRILKDDIQAFVKTQLQANHAEIKTKLINKEQLQKHGEWAEESLTRIQKRTGENLHASWTNIPHVFQMDEIDVTELEKFRKEKAIDLKSENIKLTLLAFIIKATTTAMQEFPRFNSSLIDEGNKIALKKYYNVGFATNTENGLVVPVVKDTDQKGVVQIAREVNELADLAKNKQLKIQQMEGGCFTVSNLGAIAGSFFTPIINPPEVAILGVSPIKIKPLWKNGGFIPRQVLPITLSYDHRVIDGVAGATFTRYFGEILSDIRTAIL